MAFDRTRERAKSRLNVVAIGLFGLFPVGLTSIILARYIAFKKGQARRNTLNEYLIDAQPIAKVAKINSPTKDELSLEELQHMRLLLDRAPTTCRKIRRL